MNEVNTTSSTETTVNANVPDAVTEMRAELARLRSENEALKKLEADKLSRITMKVSEKGALSLYGLSRFPVTQYPSAWLRILAVAEDIKSFIKANEGKFAVKGQPFTPPNKDKQTVNG